MALRDGRRRPKARKYESGTPVKDRVEPQLQALGYDTSTLEVVRFGRSPLTEILIRGRSVGTYHIPQDILRIYNTTKE